VYCFDAFHVQWNVGTNLAVCMRASCQSHIMQILFYLAVINFIFIICPVCTSVNFICPTLNTHGQEYNQVYWDWSLRYTYYFSSRHVFSVGSWHSHFETHSFSVAWFYQRICEIVIDFVRVLTCFVLMVRGCLFPYLSWRTSLYQLLEFLIEHICNYYLQVLSWRDTILW